MANRFASDESFSIKNNNHKKYARAFKKFLTLSNEKTILLNKIINSVNLNRHTKFLDIGAGSGHITLPISRIAQKTLTIEPNRVFAKQLKNNGIQCMNTTWENADLQGNTFDLITALFVVSHFQNHELPALILKMIRALNQGGTLIVCVVDGKKGAWRELHSKLYQLWNIKTKVSSADAIKPIMESIGSKHEQIENFFYSNTSDDILDALQFDFLQFQKEFEAARPFLSSILENKKHNNIYKINNFFDFYEYRKNNQIF